MLVSFPKSAALIAGWIPAILYRGRKPNEALRKGAFMAPWYMLIPDHRGQS
jgi:hypothetical protein